MSVGPTLTRSDTHKGQFMINKEILDIVEGMGSRPFWEIEQDVWEAIAEANGLDVDEISDGDLMEWL